MNLIDLFFQQLDPQHQPDPDPIPPGDLLAMYGQLTGFEDRTQTSTLTDEQNKLLLGKRVISLPMLMQYCAAGLRQVPELSAELETQPDSFDIIAGQDLGLGGLIKILELIAQGSQDRSLYCATEADTLCSGAAQALQEARQAPGLDPNIETLFKGTFEEAARLERQAAGARAAADTLMHGKIVQTAQQLQATQNRPQAQQTLEAFMNAAKAAAAAPVPHKPAPPQPVVTPPVIGVPVAQHQAAHLPAGKPPHKG